MLTERPNANIILAIETAVLGGSVALLNGADVLDSWMGDTDVSRSEDLVIGISELLEKNGISRAHISHIAVSTGPGSYTGMRVGIATALGLKNALNVPCIGVQVLEAMRYSIHRDDTESIASIPIGRGDICWQLSAGPIEIGKSSDLAAFLDRSPAINAIVHSAIAQDLISSQYAVAEHLEDAGRELARYIGLAARNIGLAARNGEPHTGLEPIYLRDFI